jgi:hypothetical protein
MGDEQLDGNPQAMSNGTRPIPAGHHPGIGYLNQAIARDPTSPGRKWSIIR